MYVCMYVCLYPKPIYASVQAGALQCPAGGAAWLWRAQAQVGSLLLVWGIGFRVSGLGCRVSGLGFRRFRVHGFGV